MIETRTIIKEKGDERLLSLYDLSWEQHTGIDEHGRPIFPKERMNEFHSPNVSKILAQNISIEYPGGKKFALVLTHDIDLISPSVPRRLLNSAKWAASGKLSDSLLELRGRTGKTHPYSNLHEIARKESDYGGRSTFFVMNAQKDGTGAGYDINKIAGQLEGVIDTGSEVALHGSYNAFRSATTIRQEKKDMEKSLGIKVEGYRNHFLRFQVPETYDVLTEEGFRYDSTIGFADNYGFRSGMVHPYRPTAGKGQEHGILELPLAVMDCALYSYMGLTPAEGKDICFGLLEKTKELNGALIILWHNTTYFDPRFKAWGDLYWKILEKAKQEGAWLCSGIELFKWWESSGY